MTRRAVREYLEALRPRYLQASKTDKSWILDEVCATTGMHRKSAIRGLRRPGVKGGRRRGRPRRYGPEVVEALVKVWEVGDRPCGKLLAPVLADLVGALERHGELALPVGVREALLQVSPASMDRLLGKERSRRPRQPRAQSPAAGTLRALVPIRTFGDWGEVIPGTLQADLVLHCGESNEGFYLTTLVSVDVATGWTELEAVWGMGKSRVCSGLHRSRLRLPFALRSLHTDNGSEFINHVLYPYCRKEGIALTRGQGYKKNDQAFVEQKNWMAVRRLVGYDRYVTRAAHAQLQELYSLIRLHLNFLRPTRKLVAKSRYGAKVQKRYDRAQTPYQRLLAAGVLAQPRKSARRPSFKKSTPPSWQEESTRPSKNSGGWQNAQRAPPRRRALGNNIYEAAKRLSVTLTFEASRGVFVLGQHIRDSGLLSVNRSGWF